jgi:hypothetical protein
VAELNIPKSDRQGLAVIREMSDQAIAELLVELERSPDTVPAVRNLSPADAQQVLDALNSMFRVRAYSDVSVDEFVSDVCEALRENGELRASDEPQFRERLARLLSVEALDVGAKAAVLRVEYGNVFHNARILTDARPVYGKSVSDAPEAMIIMHTLKVAYHRGSAGGRLSEFYVALSPDEISELRAALDRAEAKGKSLRSIIDASKIKLIE